MRYSAWRFMLIALLLGVVVSYGQPASNNSPNDRLFAHIYGAVAGAYIGNAMGAPVEGWDWDRAEKKYGFLDHLVPDPRNQAGADKAGVPNQAGWTEDGQERYKLMYSAIIKKGGRITVEDLARAWIEDVDPTKIGQRMGSQDRIIYDLLKAGMAPTEVGRYAIWPGLMGTSKMMQPIGIINACRPDVAAKDALDLARIKDVVGRPDNYAPNVAAAIAAATAEALRPGATVDSVVEMALAQIPDARGVSTRSIGGRSEIELGLKWAREAKAKGDWKLIRPLYLARYGTRNASNAIEVLSGGLAAFVLADGHPREAVLYATNSGRDTDCKSYVAGGLAGALRGIDAWPPEWVETVAKAVLTDPYTVDKRTPRQTAEALYKVCINELRKVERQTNDLESLLAAK